MPALGMAQKTGLIVSWLKQVGDKVSAAEIVMEIETDKTTMEVASGADGYLSQILFTAGSEVPVGEVVAVVTAEPTAAQPITAPPAAKPVAQPKLADTPQAVPASPASAPKPQTNGKIRASPKARRLARERRISLAELAAAGAAQPIQAEAVLQYQPGTTLHSSATAQAAVARYRSFTAWLQDNTVNRPQDTSIWAAFAAAGMRELGDAGRDLWIATQSSAAKPDTACYLNPDCTGLAKLKPAPESAQCDLLVIDLGKAPAAPAGQSTATLVLTVTQATAALLQLRVDGPAASLNPAQASALVAAVAQRIENPLRHML